MSDNDSDNETPKVSESLGIENNSENGSNLFNYQNRSDRGESSNSDEDDHDHDAHSEGEHEDEHLKGEQGSPNKLSEMLGDLSKNLSNMSNEYDKRESPRNSESERNSQQESDKRISGEEIKEQLLKNPEQKEKAADIADLEIGKSNLTEKTENENTTNNKESIVELNEEEEENKKEQFAEQLKIESSTESKQNKEEQPPIEVQLAANVFVEETAEEAPELTENKNKAELESKYEEELYSEIEELKRGMLGKKRSNNDKVKEEKGKLNKTFIPQSSIPKEAEVEDTEEAIELKMITMMSLSKKKENYQRLKEWDKRRAESLALHRNMIEILQNEVDKRIKSSIENLEIYTTFLREKAKQEEKYISHPIINTKCALQNNNISKNVYINCTAILNALSEQNNEKCKKIADFIYLVRNDILRDSIDVHLQQSQKELLRVREKISNLKSALRKYNSEAEEKTSELALFFNENAIKIAGDKDFYLTQIEFLQKASQQTGVQKKLGENCLEYLQVAISEEMKRSQVIREAMITFSKALQQCYRIESDPAEMEQLSKAEETKLIEEFYSLEEIFDERNLNIFKTKEKLEDCKSITIEHFSSFLNKLEFEGFDCRVLLLKEYNVRYHPSSKSETNKEQNCYLVITVDKSIHLFLSKEKTDPYAKPDISVKATMKNLELKPVKTEMLDLIIKSEKRNSMISYFWENKTDRVYRVEFNKKDSREEFIDYVRKLRG